MKILLTLILLLNLFMINICFAINNKQKDSLAYVNERNANQFISEFSSTDSLKNARDTMVEKNNTEKKYVMSKSPTKAVVYSLLLPGLGQLYVESYWKVPLFVGATGTLVYLIIDNNKKFNQYETEWKLLNDSDPNKSRLKLKKEFYRDQRDMDAFYLLGVYVISAIDAYVGAHLYDFNVSDNLSFNISPDTYRGVLLQMRIKW